MRGKNGKNTSKLLVPSIFFSYFKKNIAPQKHVQNKVNKKNTLWVWVKTILNKQYVLSATSKKEFNVNFSKKKKI